MSSRKNHIDLIGPRAIGRKNKPTPRQQNDICDYKIGARKKLIYVRKNDPQPGERAVAQIPIITGDKPCRNLALVRKPNGERRCVEHIASTYE